MQDLPNTDDPGSMQADTNISPAPAEESAEPEAPEAAPTDFGRNVWMLAIIVGVVVVAWIASIVTHRRTPDQEQAAPRPEPPMPQQPRAPQASIPVPSAALEFRVVGSEETFVLASEPLRLSPGGPAYRLPRLFNVSQRAAATSIERFVRMPGRRADQKPVPVTDPDGAAFRLARETEGLAAGDRVVALSINSTDRAYPVQGLKTCLAVRDTVAGAPVFVCWNDITQTATCLLPQVGGAEVDWLDAGLTYGGNAVVYDAASGSLWDTASGMCLAGPRSGESAPTVPVVVWPWGTWSADNPDVSVLTPPRQPATGRGAEPETADIVTPTDLYLRMQRPTGTAAGTLKDRDFVLGVVRGGVARAYPLGALDESGSRVISDSPGGQPVEVRVTSWRTGYTLAGGKPVDASVMLWFAWQAAHPETDVFRPAESVAEPGD